MSWDDGLRLASASRDLTGGRGAARVGSTVARSPPLAGYQRHLRSGCIGVAAGYVVQPVHRSAVRAGDEVSVGVYGYLDRRVPELLLNVLEALAVLQQQRRERVAQVLDVDVPQPRLLQHLIGGYAEAVR
jgi:hypothetical protein